MSECCGNCRFFYHAEQVEPRTGASYTGYCRRYPPVPVGGDGITAAYPNNSTESWCGEWQGNDESKWDEMRPK